MLDRFANVPDIESSQEVHSIIDHFLFSYQCLQLFFNSSLFLIIEPIFKDEISALKILLVEMLLRTYSRKAKAIGLRGRPFNS